MNILKFKSKVIFLNAAFLSAGLVAGLVAGVAQGKTQRQQPTEHEGVSVTPLGALPEASLKIQLGMSGYEMKLREVTVMPGGAIKKHSHATRPGLVQTISGSWIEVKNDKETEYSATLKKALVEDKDTVHWLYNKGDVPAVAIVCGLSKVE